MSLGSAIKQIRKEKGLSQKELALRCGISVTALCQIEADNAIPRKETLQSIAHELGVKMGYILFLSLSEADVPENRRSLFRTLNNAMKELLCS